MIIRSVDAYFYPTIPQGWTAGRKFFGGRNPSNKPIQLPTNEFSVFELPYFITGPHALTHFITKHYFDTFAQPSEVFYPFTATQMAANTTRPFRNPLVIPEGCLGIHHVGGGTFRDATLQSDGTSRIHPKSIVGKTAERFNFKYE